MLVDKLHSLTKPRLALIKFDATVQAAAQSLSRPGIGLVVVCNGHGGAEGVLSKSDLCPSSHRSDIAAAAGGRIDDQVLRLVHSPG